MACIPCIVIPFFLFIWHRYLQPILLRFWNPWQKIENKKEAINATESHQLKTSENGGIAAVSTTEVDASPSCTDKNKCD